MSSGQSLYWAVALPVTFVVLILAFIYGYKWDSIVDGFHRRLEHHRKANNSVLANRGERVEDQTMVRSTTDIGVRQVEGEKGFERPSGFVGWQNTVDDLMRNQALKKRPTSRTVGD